MVFSQIKAMSNIIHVTQNQTLGLPTTFILLNLQNFFFYSILFFMTGGPGKQETVAVYSWFWVWIVESWSRYHFSCSPSTKPSYPKNCWVQKITQITPLRNSHYLWTDILISLLGCGDLCVRAGFVVSTCVKELGVNQTASRTKLSGHFNVMLFWKADWHQILGSCTRVYG